MTNRNVGVKLEVMDEINSEKAKRAFYALSEHINDNSKNIDTLIDLVAEQQKMIKILIEQVDNMFNFINKISVN